MKNIFLLKLVFIGAITFFSTNALSLCECELDLPCVAYSKADAVFIGKLIKVEANKKYGTNAVDVHLEVEKIYKGKTAKMEIIEFPIDNCSMTLESFKVGETYLVYKNKPNNIFSNYCSRTGLVSTATSDLEYINSLSDNNPRFTLHGSLLGLSKEDLRNIEVFVNTNDKEARISIGDFGDFKFTTTNSNELKVTLIIPLEVAVFPNNIIKSTSVNQTIIEFSPTIKPNECEFIRINVVKSSEIGITNLSGKVVDSLKNPIPKALIYLYPYFLNQKIDLKNYELARTNDKGDYEFKKLKKGKYVLGVNITGIPRFDTPYQKTYFPNVPSIQDAFIIEIESEKEIILSNFIFPNKLKKVRISGRLHWEDGNPVLSSSSNKSINPNPFMYLIDPITLDRIDSYTEIHTVKVDSLGNFYFWGYANYKYILHVQGQNPQGELFHAKHHIIEVNENHPFINLTLDQRGEGVSLDKVKKDLCSSNK